MQCLRYQQARLLALINFVVSLAGNVAMKVDVVVEVH